ncbi:hypothetical protein MSG28_004358 [Choristoneura fumiferana]|uniref:Uncharacterized protein n=1 Tax=Choristoneura fumiferana TaxID=7141 RepID=A0ACC0KIL1_CHOFU|nr:hypothetical protein MSG28_004358 [Choristoneura fumiferana]
MGEKFCVEEVGRGYWGWMSSMGPGELVEIGGRMNSERYLEVLKDVMLPSVRVAYPEGQIYLVHDNSSVHKSKIVKDWLNSQKDITVFEWPAKSPDLNPIENLWGQMVLNWDSSEIRSKKNLDNEVNKTWELLRNSDTCFNMVSSMKTRLQEVIDSEGYPLRY